MTDSEGQRDDRFHTGPGGFLGDRNGDGFADDLALRIVLPNPGKEIPAGIWRALIDLAARAGFETGGLPDRLVVADGDAVPGDAVRMLVMGDEADESPDGSTLIVRSAAQIDRLTRPEPDAAEATVEDGEPGLVDDLTRLFDPEGGLLRDRDADLLADGTRICLRLPDPCPVETGAAAVELAARIGLESGGIDLPVGLTSDAPAPDGAIVLDLAPVLAADLREGEGRLRIDDGEPRIEGDADGGAALLRFLATTWPRVSPAGGLEMEVGRCLDALRDLATAASATGKVAALISEARDLPAGSTVHLPSSDLTEQRFADEVLAASGVTIEEIVDHDVAFVLNWEDAWEVDRAHEVFQLEKLPLPERAEDWPLDVLVAVSEPRETREGLERDFQSLVEEVVGGQGKATVRVRSAYKLGLSWIREDVIPALTDLSAVDRVEIRYAPFEPDGEGPAHLDLRIRWLQELYPGDELLAAALGLPLDAIELVEQPEPSGETYEVVAYRGGEECWRDRISPFSYSLPYVPIDPALGMVMASTGGVRVRSRAGTLLDRELPTDNDRFWHWFQAEALTAAAEHIDRVTGGEPRADQQPFFDALEVDVWVSEPDEPLGIREELYSAAEALHEDIYFGALDWFAAYGEQRGGKPFDGPGSVVPLIHVRKGPPAARVTLRAWRRFAGELITPDGQRQPIGRLDDLPAPRFAVTGVTVARDGITQLDVACTLPEGAETKRPRRLLMAASNLLEQSGDSPELPLRVSFDGGLPVLLSLPLQKPALSGVESSQGPVADDRIVWGTDLPALLAQLAGRPGVTVSTAGHSFRGRPMWVLELTAPMPTSRWSAAKLGLQKPTLLIAARHHANEVSSTTGALLLADRMTADPEWSRLLDRVNVAIIPFENPDGAALHQRLVEEHSNWKHHAARYNAVGLEYGREMLNDATPYGEARVRPMLNRRWRPDVIVDNHGVPSHEWTEHFSGFGSPPRFPVSYWLPQSLLYGIIRHVDEPEHAAFAEALRDRIATDLNGQADLRDRNAVYLDRYERWGTSRVPERFPAEVHEGFLCYVSKSTPESTWRNQADRTPRTTTLDWITEVPDETAHGAQLSATARAHLLANRAALDLMIACDREPRRAFSRRADGGLTFVSRRPRPLTPAGEQEMPSDH